MSEGAAAADFFAAWGFVVFRGVLAPRECEATVAEIWAALEVRGRVLGSGRPRSARQARRHSRRAGSR